MKIYPIKFNPIFKDKIWGGNKIKTILGKGFGQLPNCGESWELSGVENNISVVKDGIWAGRNLRELIENQREALVGNHIYRNFGNDFPLLVKFIDASLDLSIQVHPDDRLAGERYNSRGKTEMWYIIHADPGSTLISGFSKSLDKNIYLDYLKKGKIATVLNIEQAEKDDVFFIPAGRIHTIGKGLLLAEIQQSSDITYRIYDFDRLDNHGNKRELHTEQALDAIDFKVYDQYKLKYQKDSMNEVQRLVESQFFTTNKLFFNDSFTRNYGMLDSFVILTCLQGSGTIRTNGENTNILMGEVVLIPAAIKEIILEINNEIKLLETYIS